VKNLSIFITDTSTHTEIVFVVYLNDSYFLWFSQHQKKE